MKFNAALLRERFNITTSTPASAEAGDESTKPINITAMSTRMAFDLQSGNLPPERFVVRTHNMQSCARMVGKILNDYDKKGPILSRSPALDMHELWDDCLNHYDRAYNKPWVCVYNKGKPYFIHGEHHPFLDVIEKCDAVQKPNKNYDESIKLAQIVLNQAAGASAKIDFESTVAVNANLERSISRCGLILRGPDRTNNLNIAIQETATSGKMNISLGLFVSAAILEGMQLSFFIGQQQIKLKRGIIQRFSSQDKQTREARERLATLEAEISATENRYTTRFRPERPNFQENIEVSKRAALRTNFRMEDSRPGDTNTDTDTDAAAV